jgi:hypothetical protein
MREKVTLSTAHLGRSQCDLIPIRKGRVEPGKLFG